jgi:hypothetical protein
MGFCKIGDEVWGYKNSKEFHNQLNNYKLPKEVLLPWNY